MTSYGLSGKIALVTGAARGIGLGIAKKLKREGCQVILNDIDETALSNAADQLAEEGQEEVVRLAGSIADGARVKKMFAQIKGQFGRLDILVNNAGLLTIRKWFWDLEDDFFDKVLTTNMRGTYLVSQAAAKLMIPQKSGSIIVISSIGATRAFRGSVPYVTSKGALDALTRGMAMDLARYGIRVNAVAPGMIATDLLWKNTPEQELKRRRQMVPLEREGFPEDVAGAVAFLASQDASYITGQVIVVDGGVSSQCYPYTFEVPSLLEAPPEL